MIIKLDEFNMVSFNNRRAVRKNHTKPVARWRKHRILPRNFHHLISKLTFVALYCYINCVVYCETAVGFSTRYDCLQFPTLGFSQASKQLFKLVF
jgi:hypothetical protein